MPTKRITFDRFSAGTVKAQRVYLREHWTDEWTLVPWLWCTEANWAAPPTIPQATLVWRYGEGRRQNAAAAAIVERLTGKSRWWVKIEFDPPEKITTVDEDNTETDVNDPLVWHGSLELEGDSRNGSRKSGETVYRDGMQSFVCYGLELQLAKTYVREAHWRDGDEVKKIDRPIIFNRPDATGVPQGNRTTERKDLVHQFSGDVDPEERSHWSTLDVVQYLLHYHSPATKDGYRVLGFLFDHETEDVLPDWDKPVVDPRKKSVWELLNSLIYRGRLISFRVYVEPAGEDSEFDTVRVTFYSLVGAEVDTGEGKVPPNDDKLAIDFEQDVDAMASLRTTHLQHADQVIALGARRTSTGPFSYLDGTFDAGWTDELKTEYDGGGSTADDYGDKDKDEKQLLNHEARADDRLAMVYRRFIIPEDWDGKCGDGLGTGDPLYPMFPIADGSEECYPIYPPEMYVLPTLPLKDGYDYTDLGSLNTPKDPVKETIGPFNHVQALVFLKDPETERYIQIENIGRAAGVEILGPERNRLWSAHVDIARQDRGVLLHVNGSPQHTLAYEDFVPTDVDEDVGRWSWRDAVFVLAIADDRFCEIREPADEILDSEIDHPRRIELDFGDDYRLDYMVPGTPVGVSAITREFRRSGGGWIRDDRPKLRAKAKLAYAYYRQARTALTFSTRRINAAIRIGHYVESIGPAENSTPVGSVVTEMQIDFPLANRVPQLTYATAFVGLEHAVG